MHGYSRLGPSSSPHGHGRRNVSSVGGVVGVADSKLQNYFMERLVYVFISTVYRRRGVLLLAPLLYISGMLLLFYISTLGFKDVVVDLSTSTSTSSHSSKLAPPPGSVYRSPQVFQNLLPFMENGSSSSPNALMNVWNAKLCQGWKPCVDQTISQPAYYLNPAYQYEEGVGVKESLLKALRAVVSRLEPDGNRASQALAEVKMFRESMYGFSDQAAIRGRTRTDPELPKSNGFLIIEANGGLNQQRLSICDAVAVAGLLNATLVIPIFHLNSVWRDSSKFRDIFDEEFFIYALRNHVTVVRELPDDILQRFDNNISNIANLRVKAWSSTTYYLQKVLPKLVEMGAVRIAPFSNRLAHAVPSNIQGLRCLSNFQALRFSGPIRMLADKMVDRMINNSSKSGGRYISVHLRFEEDMVAFSCCVYDGGEEEKREMDNARERSWRGKFRRRGRIIKPGAIRVDGKCPLTPLEVGMMLRGMGFDNSTSLYVAAGKIYKVEKYMAPLKQIFPLLETKDTLASPEELALFMGHSSRLAALDYTVCLHSEVFVTTQGGNFPHFLMGHRRYFYGGHAKTIKPDKRKLALLFDSPKIRWENFKRQLQDMLHHSEVKGIELRKPSGSLYTYPMPDCMCKQADTEKENSSNT